MKVDRHSIVLAVLVAAMPVAGQQRLPHSETTFGNCSPNMSHKSGSVYINCRNLDPEVASQLSDIVRSISSLENTAKVDNRRLVKEALKQIRASLDEAFTKASSEKGTNIFQSSSGSCSPNIVGTGNTTICGPQDLQVTPQQALLLTRHLQGVPQTIARGTITVLLEVQNRATQVAGQTLITALQNAGVNVKVETAVMMLDAQDNFGGVSFKDVGTLSEPFANMLGVLLQQLGVVSGPVPAFGPASEASPTADFTIVIRRVQ